MTLEYVPELQCWRLLRGLRLVACWEGDPPSGERLEWKLP